MTVVNQLITDHLDIWTAATEKKSSAGRGSGGAVSLYGVKKLRSLVLELAVRGKLVQQHEDDGTAEMLLEELKRGKAELVAKGEIKKPRQIEHRDAPVRHSVPSGWRWVPLDQVGAVVGGGTPKASDPKSFKEPGEGFPWLTPADLSGNTEIYIERGNRDLSEIGLAKSSATRMPANTVLFTSRAPIGYVAISVGPIATNQGFKSVVPFHVEMSRYIALVLSCFAPEIDAAAPGTTFKEVSGKIVAGLSFPLPPLAEQHRIVAKVDELMALCDALERQAEDSLKAHQTLVETCLATLTNSRSTEELTQNWTRIEAHFDTLFTTEESVESLVQALLKLIYSGLLSSGPGKKAKLAKIGTYRKLQNGFAFKSGTFQEDGIRLLRNINIGHDQIDWTETVCLSFEAALEFKRFELNQGDIVLTLDRPFISTGTKVARIQDADLPSLLLQRVGRFVATSEGLDDDYLFLWLNSELFKEQVVPGRSNGVPHISSKQVEGAEIFVPSLEEQRRLVDLLTLMFGDCRSLQTRISIKNKHSTDLADTLTSKIH